MRKPTWKHLMVDLFTFYDIRAITDTNIYLDKIFYAKNVRFLNVT